MLFRSELGGPAIYHGSYNPQLGDGRGLLLGEVSTEADIETAVIALHGAFWYQMLTGKALDQDFANSLSALIFRSVR